MTCTKTQYVKTGSRDKDSDWARSRNAILRQFQRDIVRQKTSIHGTLFVDKHSEFCALGKGVHNGQGGKRQWQAPLKDGKWCDPKDGGELEPVIPRQKPMHPARADGLFGVCTPMVGGRAEGCKMRPLRYRGKVVGITNWDDALAALEERARKMGRDNREKLKDPFSKSRPGVWLNYTDEPHPYEARFGPSWRDHLPKSFGLTSIKELIDHTISEGNRFFKGTAHENTWWIYHDALLMGCHPR